MKPLHKHLKGIALHSLTVAFIIFSIGMNAQTSKNTVKRYKIKIKPLNESKMIIGILYSADSVGIKVMDLKTDNYDLKLVKFQNIESVWLRKRGRFATSVAIGAIAGLGIGAAIGSTSGDGGYLGQDFAAAAGGVLGTIIGSAVGVSIGSKKVTFNVFGDRASYLFHLETLQEHSLIN